MLEESLSGVPHNNRRPDPKFLSSKDGTSSSGGGKGGQATAAASEQQQQGVDSNGPGGETAEGARGGDAKGTGGASDNDAFEVLTVSDDKWISPDLPPEAGKQQQDLLSAGGGDDSSSGSSRPGVGARGPQVGRHTVVASLTPQQMAGLGRVSQRRGN